MVEKRCFDWRTRPPHGKEVVGWRGHSCALLGISSDQTLAQSRISNDNVKLGVLTDMSSLYADNSGPGSVAAAQMAVADFGGRCSARRSRSFRPTISTSPMSAPASPAGSTEGVDVIVDVPNSAVALAVQEITRTKNKVFLATGTASSRLTADVARRPRSTGLTTPMLGHGTGRAVVETGGDTWFFIAADFAVGAALQADTTAVINAKGGRVLGGVRHPINLRLRVLSACRHKPPRPRSSALPPPVAT